MNMIRKTSSRTVSATPSTPPTEPMTQTSRANSYLADPHMPQPSMQPPDATSEALARMTRELQWTRMQAQEQHTQRRRTVRRFVGWIISLAAIVLVFWMIR